tara:strand:+ start:132 stop:545 length:414 start_codon:yes stop_codon:yes gene_type:complete
MSLDIEGAQNLKKSEKCEDRIEDAILSRGEDFERFMNAEDDETIEEFYQYGLDISMVSMGTFKNMKEPYLRYQLSWGGPSEEINFYQNGRVEFVFKDWFDYAAIEVSHLDWIEWLRDWFVDTELLTDQKFFSAWRGE